MHLFDNYEQVKFLWDRNKDIFAHDIRILIPKGNPWVVLHSHGPINNSYSCYAETVYLAIMLQAFWHIAEGK